jgi:hypothetical protein
MRIEDVEVVNHGDHTKWKESRKKRRASSGFLVP